MSFVPPFFNDFGKSYNDLAKKKFDYKNTAKLTNKTSNGLTLETTGYLNESSVSAAAKVTQKEPSFGESELNLCTASGSFTCQTKAKKLVDGATFTLSGGYAPPKKASTYTGFFGQLAAEYNQEFFAGKSSLKFSDGLNGSGLDLSASGVIGFQGLSVGGQVDLDCNKSAFKECNLGVQYTADDFTATLRTRKNLDVIDASWYHKINRNQTAGVLFTLDTDTRSLEKELTFATEYQLDVDTTLKAKANSSGVLSAACEHRLQNPRLKYNVAAEFKSLGGGIPKASKFGLGFSFGDF